MKRLFVILEAEWSAIGSVEDGADADIVDVWHILEFKEKNIWSAVVGVLVLVAHFIRIVGVTDSALAEASDADSFWTGMICAQIHN